MEAGDLFDQIDDLLEFPNEDDLMLDMGDTSVPADVSDGQVAHFDSLMLPILEEAFLSGTEGQIGNSADISGSEFGNIAAGANSSGEQDHLRPCDELDITQLEWLSTIFDDIPDNPSPSTMLVCTKPGSDKTSTAPVSTKPASPINVSTLVPTEEDPLLFYTSSPVSVLENCSFGSGGGVTGGSGGGGSFASSSSYSTSSSSSSNNFSLPVSPRSVNPPEPVFVIPARARTRRPRPAAFSPRCHVTIPLLPPSSDLNPPRALTMVNPSSVESMAESDPMFLPEPMKKKKKMGKKLPVYGEDQPSVVGEERLSRPAASGVRRCMHCQIEKTPQWRAGPMGPKTLCNACGVRYKSGRLFPEYRPAASPTFVPSLHSNSHKKVVEMRLKATQESKGPRGCTDLLDLIRRREE